MRSSWDSRPIMDSIPPAKARAVRSVPVLSRQGVGVALSVGVGAGIVRGAGARLGARDAQPRVFTSLPPGAELL